MDLLLDSETGDVIFENGSCPVTPDRISAVRQKLKIKLQTFLGEWFLDTTYGIPYFQQVFTKQRDKATVDSIFQKAILEEDGVIRIIFFQSTLSSDRIYSLVFDALGDDGLSTGNISASVTI